jgi:hypothetical protein
MVYTWGMYNALITPIQVREHPDADKLQLGLVHGYQVVVGLDTQDGELGVFFDADGQVSPEYAEANDLIGYTDPDTHERKGGFFPKNRRVRSQKFRGQVSDGYWAPLSSLAFTGADLSKLQEGDQFTELNGVPICNKYFTPKTLKQMAGQQQQKRQNVWFAKHVDTAQLKHAIDEIPLNSVLYFTLKMHGTSGRFGHVLDEKVNEVSRWRRLWNKLPIHKASTTSLRDVSTDYTYVLGTRNVVQADHTHQGFYGNEEFRWNAVEKLNGNLHKGEILYYELTGYTTTGQPIMGEVDTSSLKEIKKQYGPKMVYKYGQPVGTTGLWVYRITRVNEEGVVTELSWPEVKKRCRELGINHVPEMTGSPIIYTGNPEQLNNIVNGMLEGPDPVDPSHIREGVVIRAEHEETKFYKAKSWSFKVLEGIVKSDDEYVDMEEVS